jgi:UDP-glucuronate 4-epimerase
VKILVTGSAGFIGYSLSKRLLDEGHSVYGIDNLNDYYNVQLKHDRLSQLKNYPAFHFQKIDISQQDSLLQYFQENDFEIVVHLAAQAGVRYSLENPFAYSESNLVGFLNILEGCRHSSNIKHLVYASSSSVYGASRHYPFSVKDNVDNPVSLYAATKKANELMAHTYSHLYNLPTTGLRFFTVYGPWGRPDMAYFKFVDAIAHNRSIDVYNYGKMKRDFTYIDDVVEGIIRVMNHPPIPLKDGIDKGEDEINAKPPYKIYNLGNNQPVELLKFIQVIESAMGKPAQKNLKPLQPGDVEITYADVDDLINNVAFSPSTPIEEGIEKFVIWYRNYFNL